LSARAERPLVEIQAGRAGGRYLRDLWQARHLVLMFSWREIALRYKQTVAGVLWVVLRPLATTAIFALVFGKFLQVPSDGLPFALLVLAGLVPWQFAAYSFSGAADSLLAHAGVISKVYFPRLVVPLSVFVVNVIDLLVCLALLAAFMAAYGVAPDARVLALPLFVLAALPAAAGLGLWFAALTARYRDFRHVTPFVVMLSLYASPVAYPANVVPDAWRLWYWLNPLTVAIEGFRWSLFRGAAELHWPGIGCSLALSAAVLVAGYAYFRRAERSLADVI
jgi:lipopolysaccharide transport system permease protein